MSLPVIDLHTDTWSKKWLLTKSPLLTSFMKEERKDKESLFDVTPERLEEGNVRILTTSLFQYNSFMDKPFHHSMTIISGVLDFIKKNEGFYLLKSKQNLDFEHRRGIMLSIEGLEVVEANLRLLDVFYELGVRMVGPNWNRITPWLSPVTEKYGAFSAAGDLAEKLNDLNVLVDISHLSDQSVIDFEKICRCPFIASHSNFRSLNKAERNLSDDLVKIIRERDGLIGINFYPDFLCCGEAVIPEQKDGFIWIKRLLDQCDELNCWDQIAFGSDFDGIERFSLGLENPSCFKDLQFFLKECGLEEEKIEKLFYKNALRVIKNNLPE